MIDDRVTPIEHYREGLTRALRYGPEACTFDTLTAAVDAGTAQYWPFGESVIVTQIQGTCLHFWLAAGRKHELQQLTPLILEWGKEQGCTVATLVGRPGWLRSFLPSTGWTPSPLVMMQREL